MVFISSFSSSVVVIAHFERNGSAFSLIMSLYFPSIFFNKENNLFSEFTSVLNFNYLWILKFFAAYVVTNIKKIGLCAVGT